MRRLLRASSRAAWAMVLSYSATSTSSRSAGEQVADALVGVARQVFEVLTDVAAQAGDFLRQDDAELRYQAAQAVVDRGAFFDKALPGAVQGEDDLLEFSFTGTKRMLGRVTVSQMAAASAASFCRACRSCVVGVTNLGQ